jgi:drug/metabolite transporter (DMT)-like permease
MPVLSLTVSLFVLSQSALLVRLAKTASALDIGFWRMAMAIPVLLLLGAAQGHLREIRALKSKQVLSLALCGLCLFLHWWTWFLAVQTTALANAMVLFAISPVFTAIGAWFFFREPFERRHGVALGCCFLGVYFIFRDSITFTPNHIRGDMLGFLSSIFFSAYVLMGKGIRRETGNVPFTIVAYAFCGLLFFAALTFRGELHADFGEATWLAILGLAVGPTLLGHALFTYCLQFFNVNFLNISILTEPVFGSFVAYWVLGETFGTGALIGFMTICAGVLALFAPALVRAKA